MGVKLGLHAKLYRNTGSAGTPAWNEIANVRDVTLNLETGEADVSTRGNGGWRANIATLKGATLEFEMMWDTADDDFTAIREAFLNNTPIEFAVLDGASNQSGSQGLRASMAIINFMIVRVMSVNAWPVSPPTMTTLTTHTIIMVFPIFGSALPKS